MKLRLYAMGSKGLAVLEALTQKFGSDIFESVLSDHDVGLLEDSFGSIRDFCAQNKIAFHPRRSAPLTQDENFFSLAIGWRWMLPPNPKLFIIHDSLLPKYRGFAPLVSALINGEKRVGATLLRAAEHYDEGPILYQKTLPLKYPAVMTRVLKDFEKIYAQLSLSLVATLSQGKVPKGRKQIQTQASYSLWRDARDYRLDFNESAEKLLRKIHALAHPYPGALAIIDGVEHRILEAKVFPDVKIVNRVAGKLLFYRDNFPVLVCGKGLLQIKKILDPSGKSLSFPLKNFRTRFE